MMTPAIAGPISRAALNIDEFSAMAFARSSLFGDHRRQERLARRHVERVHDALNGVQQR